MNYSTGHDALPAPGSDGMANRQPAMDRYLIVANKTGQLGNRMTLYAHMLAAARQCGWQLINPSFCEYADYFEGTRGRLLRCGLAQANAQSVAKADRQWAYRINRIAYKCARVIQHLPHSPIGWARASNMPVYDLGELMERAQDRGWRWLFTQNYVFRQHDWCARHADYIRQVFTPVAVLRARSRDAVAQARSGRQVLVGIHIRHGDYRQHLHGRFFYEVASYVEMMKRMRDLLAPRTVSFLVCSNAQHEPGCFGDLQVTMGPGHLVVDLDALAGCDYIIGPPSSFNSWAAFYGRKPLLVMEEEKRTFTLEDFRMQPSVNPLY